MKYYSVHVLDSFFLLLFFFKEKVITKRKEEIPIPYKTSHRYFPKIKEKETKPKIPNINKNETI